MGDSVDNLPLELHAQEPPDQSCGSDPAPMSTDAATSPADGEATRDGPPTTAIIEAVLFASDNPLKPAKLAEIAGVSGGTKVVSRMVDELNARYGQAGSAFRIEQIAGGYQMLTLPAFHPWLAQLVRVRQEARLSAATLETLAIIAYKQPILRADVEAIRGVSSGDMINRLRELNLVKIVGRAEDVGRPMLYGTTRRFMEVFGLASLDELPKAEELPPPH